MNTWTIRKKKDADKPTGKKGVIKLKKIETPKTKKIKVSLSDLAKAKVKNTVKKMKTKANSNIAKAKTKSTKSKA